MRLSRDRGLLPARPPHNSQPTGASSGHLAEAERADTAADVVQRAILQTWLSLRPNPRSSKKASTRRAGATFACPRSQLIGGSTGSAPQSSGQ